MTIPPPADATMIGKYQILELAGEGAMGAVYRARDTVLNRLVAIKVMNATIACDTTLRDRFLREAQSAGSLQHPNVVTVYDFGEVDGHLFIAMEFVEGSDLEELLAVEEPLSLETKLDIMIDALTGLGYAHQHGIVHRDIKPANIRVTRDWHAKLMDFGVAHLESSTVTKTGTMIGTPSYMAPEAISGEPTTTISDIFSMGAVLYHVLTGRNPFSGETLHAVLFSVMQADPPLPSSIVPSLPPALDQIVRRAMAKDPVDRYQTALDMATALTSLRGQMRGLPANATQSLSTTLAHRVPSRGASATRDASSRTGAPLAKGAPTNPSAPDMAVDVPAVPAKAGSRMTMLVVSVATLAIVAAAGVFFSTQQSTTTRSGEDSAAAPRAVSSSEIAPAVPPSGVDANSPPTARAPEKGATGAVLNTPITAAARGSKPAAGAKVEAPKTPASVTPDTSLASRQQSQAARVASVGAGTAAGTANATPPVSPPQAAAAPPVTNVPVPPTAAAETGPARNVPNELRDLIARYAQAISARDVSAIRDVYPGLTSQQQRGFEQFFASIKALQATLSLGSIDVTDATAAGRVSGVYAFTTSSGRNEKQTVNFRATFARQGDKWRLSSVQ